jgi:hypothetical protein
MQETAGKQNMFVCGGGSRCCRPRLVKLAPVGDVFMRLRRKRLMVRSHPSIYGLSETQYQRVQNTANTV